MKFSKSHFSILAYIFLFGISGCHDHTNLFNQSAYKYVEPDYNSISLKVVGDTLSFLLNDTTYNDIECMNYFESDSSEYVSFFDRRSASVNIYNILSKSLRKKIILKHILPNIDPEKTSIYVINFDSILIADKRKIVVIDSSENLRSSITYLTQVTTAKAYLDNSCPPISIGSKIVAGVKPSGTLDSYKECKSWKIIYEFDFDNDSAKLIYNYSPIYYDRYFGYQYLRSSYCYSDNSKFIVSFPADSNIYETDLDGYHISYYGKSKFHKDNIKPLAGESDKVQLGSENYATNHAYGSIYFDKYRCRYLRISKCQMSQADYLSRNKLRGQSVIVFDRNLKIIGESSIDPEIDLSTLFFTKNGSAYARIKRSDEYALYFIKIQYSDREDTKEHLVQQIYN